MEKPSNWSELTWEQKRDIRFNAWLNPEGVKFVNGEAEEVYKQRVTRFIKAFKLEEPDRVPVMLPTHTYPASHGGFNFHGMMYDYARTKECWIKFMNDFGDMDSFSGPGLVPSGKISEVMCSKNQLLPGLGLPEDSPTNQYVEGEYMSADEYDLLALDESDFNVRYLLPRTTGLLEPLKKLPPLRNLQGTTLVALLRDPELRSMVQKLLDLGDEYDRWTKAMGEIAEIVISRGYPPLMGGGFMAGAPYDFVADMLRGTKGISQDMFRRPQKIHDFMERRLKMNVEAVKEAPITRSPIVMMPLHKGDDMFMSDKQFDEFYWPTLKATFMAMIDEGLVPMPFAEGRYTRRLKQITDTPPSGVAWYFDQTDMALAKQTLKGICCIAGNLPSSNIMTGTPELVKANCRKLIETCAPGGGYILAAGASVEKGDINNLHAMMNAAKEYGIYKK
jgi:uroporphyrinogen-III decarboxylase